VVGGKVQSVEPGGTRRSIGGGSFVTIAAAFLTPLRFGRHSGSCFQGGATAAPAVAAAAQPRRRQWRLLLRHRRRCCCCCSLCATNDDDVALLAEKKARSRGFWFDSPRLDERRGDEEVKKREMQPGRAPALRNNNSSNKERWSEHREDPTHVYPAFRKACCPAGFKASSNGWEEGEQRVRFTCSARA
jgi:hypothetical protein